MNEESQEPKECPEAYEPNDAKDEQSKINPTKVKLQVRRWDRLNDLEYVCRICDQKYAQKKGFEKHVALHGNTNTSKHFTNSESNKNCVLCRS